MQKTTQIQETLKKSQKTDTPQKTETHITICFDLDGTLINSAPDLLAALDHCLTKSGRAKSTHKDIRPHIGQGAKAMISKALLMSDETANQSELNETELHHLWEVFIAHYSVHSADHSHPFEAAIWAIEQLKKAGHTLAICTNKTKNLTTPLLQKLDLTKHFATITCADSYPFKKPDPRHLLNTISEAGGTPARAIMIGDSKTDIETARNAGIPSIGVDWGYTDIPMQDLLPDFLISHFNELPDLIKSISLKI